MTNDASKGSFSQVQQSAAAWHALWLQQLGWVEATLDTACAAQDKGREQLEQVMTESGKLATAWASSAAQLSRDLQKVGLETAKSAVGLFQPKA